MKWVPCSVFARAARTRARDFDKFHAWLEVGALGDFVDGFENALAIDFRNSSAPLAREHDWPLALLEVVMEAPAGKESVLALKAVDDAGFH
jgi:hypothetical protein